MTASAIVEHLERRQMLSAVQVGPETLVNSHTVGNQTDPAVALDSAGDDVVVWSSFGQDGSGWGVFAQQYNAFGNPIGSEFQVNTYTKDNQKSPTVAMDAAGDFVIAWQSLLENGYGYDIYARCYDASGVAQGDEFQVNTRRYNYQANPSVAMDAAGDFVIAWQSRSEERRGGKEC